MSETLTPLGEIRVNVLRGGLSGVGTAGRLAEWESSTVLGDSTLVKSGVGVLTLSAAGDYTLTVPATGTAALLATDNVFTTTNTMEAGLKLGTSITQTPTSGGVIMASELSALSRHGFISAYRNLYLAGNAYHDGTNWKTLITDGTYGGSSIISNDLGNNESALIVLIDPTIRNAGDTRVYTEAMRVDFSGQLRLPVTGSTAGILLGGDAQIYRSAANVLRTPDSLTVDAGLNVGSATGAGTGQGVFSGNVAIGYTTTPNSYQLLLLSGTVTAASAIAIAEYIAPTLVASANNDALYGLFVKPAYNDNGKTGVTHVSMIVGAAAGENPLLRITDDDVAQPFTVFPSNTVGQFTVWSSTAGGLNIGGVTDSDSTAFGYVARVGATSITVPAMIHRAGKHDGAGGSANLTSTEIHTRWEQISGSTIMTLYGTGNLTVVGAFGCNTKAAQTSYASGGALAAYAAGANGLSTGAAMSALHALVVNIRAALVANGIMS